MQLGISLFFNTQIWDEVLSFHQVMEFPGFSEQDDLITGGQFVEVAEHLAQCVVVPGQDDISSFPRVSAGIVMTDRERGRIPCENAFTADGIFSGRGQFHDLGIQFDDRY